MEEKEENKGDVGEEQEKEEEEECSLPQPAGDLLKAGGDLEGPWLGLWWDGPVCCHPPAPPGGQRTL